MRAVLQRVTRASVSVDDEVVASIERGLLVLLGVGRNDGAAQVRELAGKVADLRIFGDAAGRMNLSLRDVGGAALVVPQFTLYADLRKGRRPDFGSAAPPADAERLCEAFAGFLGESDVPVQTGRFGAHMVVALENDGPVTVILTTDGWDEGALRGR